MAPPDAPRRPFAVALATGFGLGYAPIAPGTFGSLLALPLHALALAASGGSWTGPVAGALLAAALGAWATRRALCRFDRDDPGEIVADEVAGQWIALLFLPADWRWWAAAFVAFRLLDVWKPGPVRRLEKLPGASGIMADDLVAGLLANVALQIALAAISFGSG